MSATALLVKQSAAFTPESQENWRSLTRSLDDGRYIVCVWHEGSAAGQIESLAAWYNGVTESEMHDPAFLDLLIVRSNSLAYYLLRLSQEQGELYAEKNAAELQRKRAYFASLARLRKEAKARAEKFIHAVAEVEAENEVADLKAAETLADSLHQQTRLLYESGRDILQRMSQQISNLKSYRDAYLRSDNSSFPQQ